ncbi:WD40 repeat-like protein [Hesseltinella vesiculosa]|uniref:WD40 repeat-like protein n=1 Tax=Hesseltinella vesiculosa TaxID=101127 RepID=A0A1X2GTU2_9FUNG|nr:WD40 repeat-like protein [Hesseltinella vesiculosa]
MLLKPIQCSLCLGGVNGLDIETVEQRYLMSGGADGRIHIYDLQVSSRKKVTKIPPIASVSRADRHLYAVSSVSWYPFDTGMFISSSYDQTIRVWDTNEMNVACTFPLDSLVHCQAISPIASHSLVAAAAAEPRIRLCDLRSGAFTHSLSDHVGEVYSCLWSPSQEFTLYSGGSDGTVRVWDIRRASACLASLDQENGADPLGETNTAHGGRPVNGLTASADGQYLVTLGKDEKIRLWDTTTGKNMLVNYGSYFRNRYKSRLQPVISDADVWPPLLFVPSDDQQVLVYGLLDGKLTKRLRGAYGRVTCVEQRASHQEIYSGSNEGDILVWEANPTPTLAPSSSANPSQPFPQDDIQMDTWSDSDDENDSS